MFLTGAARNNKDGDQFAFAVKIASDANVKHTTYLVDGSHAYQDINLVIATLQAHLPAVIW